MVFVAARSEPHCSYCKGELDNATAPFCRECGVSIHLDCWEGFGGCATAFCVESPSFEETLESKTAQKTYGETFPSATRFCPQCGSQRVGIFCGECGVDFVTLDNRQVLVENGRATEELLSVLATKIESEASPLVRGSLFKKAKHCINCGFSLVKDEQCQRCLYEAG